jgi:YkoY family integral membrane protein
MIGKAEGRRQNEENRNMETYGPLFILPSAFCLLPSFHQTFEPHDLLVILLLIVLEGLLSVDNAMVLGLMATRLPEALRGKALSYGLIGALIFRLLAIGGASEFLRWRFAQLIGGLFLLSISMKHLRSSRDSDSARRPCPDSKHDTAATAASPGFWRTVGMIEITDVIFAVDSILAAVALVGPAPPDTPLEQPHPKLWVVLVGGMGGVVLMRYAAFIFIKLLTRFPRLETSAYLLVIVIGGKMTLSFFFDGGGQARHSHLEQFSHPATWIYWGLMAAAFLFGFIPRRFRDDGNDQ